MSPQDNRLAQREARIAELSKLSEEELKTRFWELCNRAVVPLIDLAKSHTSPSIERAVLMRMGLDSLTAKAVVERCVESGLLAKGAGHVVLRVSQQTNTDIPKAAKQIIDNKEILNGLF